MAISQLEQAMATLRLGIAEMRAREEQLDAQINQFQTQLRRLPSRYKNPGNGNRSISGAHTNLNE